MLRALTCLIAAAATLLVAASASHAQTPANQKMPLDTVTPRKPASDAELKAWLDNMITYHHYSTQEIERATGLSTSEIAAAIQRFKILPTADRPETPAGSPLLVLPYPGGRHPRAGFLDGAIDPQRDTKISIFLPWDKTSYVVADLPEALWSNLGLTYLAHTHVPTLWSKQGAELEPLEWQTQPDGTLEMERALPNQIRFGTRVLPGKDAVRYEQWLTNGTDQPLSDLRVQNCVMLKAAAGFETQNNDNKLIQSPFVACRSETGDHWIIAACQPCHRPWANASVPCLHSDPRFPDCPPGQTVRLKGWISFFEGSEADLKAEFKRIEDDPWWRAEAAREEAPR